MKFVLRRVPVGDFLYCDPQYGILEINNRSFPNNWHSSSKKRLETRLIFHLLY